MYSLDFCSFNFHCEIIFANHTECTSKSRKKFSMYVPVASPIRAYNSRPLCHTPTTSYKSPIYRFC